MTVSMLRAAGALVEHVDEITWRVEPGPIDVGVLAIEPDLSNAGPVPRRGRGAPAAG
jgi:3-phosphoshikimate 1-carboxyvinyltransferase